MPIFSLRYDLRCPPISPATPQELAAEAVAQCARADEAGFLAVTLSEHHGSPDGYLPSPMLLGAAVAARTRRLRLVLGALVAPLHDPLRLAEDLAVLDVLSGGRVLPVLGAGYVAAEFEAFGKSLRSRGRAVEVAVQVLEKAWTGEGFEHEGRRARVTPRPVQRPRPPIWLGGSSPAAARRAARIADGFLPALPALHEVFRAERTRLGRPDPGPLAPLVADFVHVARDPEAAWARIAPHALHESNAYARWAAEADTATPFAPARDAEALRAGGRYLVLTPEALVERLRAMPPHATVMLHPLVGGLDPALGWESLELVVSDVMPAFAAD